MNPASFNEQQHHILFDSDVVSQIVPQWFTIEYWQDNARVKAATRGRGRAWFIDSAKHKMVLRHYQRGGAMARILADRYLWQGLDNTRAWREWRLLADLWQQGLPVPQPLAAHVKRQGIFYFADLLTGTIPHSRSLSDWLLQQPLEIAIWHAIGQLIRRFHDANVYHADLNAHNILIGEGFKLYLIDFDKGRIVSATKTPQSWKEGNLKRLQRSLQKCCVLDKRFHYTDHDWLALMDGYTK